MCGGIILKMNFHFLIIPKKQLYLYIFKILNLFFNLLVDGTRMTQRIRAELKNDPEKRILIIHSLNIGDLLITTPILSTIHSLYPRIKIDVMAKKSAADVLKNNPHINGIFYYDEMSWPVSTPLEKREYFLILDLANSFIDLKRTLAPLLIKTKYRIGFKNKYYAGLFNHINTEWKLNNESEAINYHSILKPLVEGLKAPSRLELFLSEEEKRDFQSIIIKNGLKNKGFIVVHPASQSIKKHWSEDKFSRLIEMLKSELKYDIVLTSSDKADERGYIKRIKSGISAEVIDLAGKLSMREWFYIVGKTDLLITIDTSAIHVASAMDTPTVALFGSSNRSAWQPFNKKNQLMVYTNVCPPCEKDFVFNECRFGDVRCMQSISVESVFSAAKKLLMKQKN